jgi:DNA-binding MarR family transcriptional regulator
MRLFFNRWPAVSAADVVGGVFIAQRDLLKSFRSHALAGSGLTPEIAEILIELYLAGNRLSSTDHVDAHGYISFRELRTALDYSPGLLSRRVTWLCARQWAETRRALPDVTEGLHGNSQKVRITQAGTDKIAPIWRRFDKLSERVLSGISPSDLGAHYRINEIISDTLRTPQFWTVDTGAMDEKSAAQPPPAMTSSRKRGAAPKKEAPSKTSSEEAA